MYWEMSIFAQGSALSSSNEVGHNCFSWAYEQLEELNDPRLMETMPQSFDDRLKFVIRISSRALPTEAALQPHYNVLGGESIIPQNCAWSSSNEVVHSCFSWACQHLKELNDPGLMENMPRALDDPRRFIIGIPSRALLKDGQQNHWIWNPSRLAARLGES